MSFIGIDTQNIENVRAALHKMPGEVQDGVIDAVNHYLLDVMRLYPPQKYVSRKAAYGVTFFTDKQRRWFFANLNDGTLGIPYKRTQAARNTWRIEGQGRGSFLVNDIGYGGYLYNQESRHMAAIGWEPPDKTIQKRMPRIDRLILATVEKILKRLGLK